MRFRLTSLMLALVTAVAVVAAHQAGSAQVALEAARKTEVIDGNLNAAIKQYQAIVDKYARTDRAVAATALIHVAECYQKLGDAQARTVYERVVREFADINDAAVAARSRLAALNADASARTAPALTMRRLYDGPGFDWCNGLSSDIRYLSHRDWTTGNIAIADLRNGSVRPVTTSGSISLVTAQTGEFGECAIFSPDDKRIAFYWDAGKTTELRVVGIDGSNPRTLYKGDTTKPYLRTLDWSHDGRLILTAVSLKKTTHIAAFSAADGTVRIVKELGEATGNVDAQFSPDGRYIAYTTREGGESTRRDVFLIASDGTGDTPVVRHPADDRLLGWAPDGRTLFFASDRTGSFGVWSLGIENGQPRGTLILVKADLGPVAPIRFLNGTLYYLLNSQMSDIYIAGIDPESGKGRSAPVPAKANFSGSNATPDWSPDGTSLAYLSFRGTAGYPAAPEHVAILNLQTGVERRIRPALELLEPYGGGPVWSPDGRSLLVIARQKTPQHGLYRVDAQTGATTTVVKAPGQFLLHAVWGRDGRSVFYTLGGGCAGQEPCPQRILRHDLATGMDAELVSLPNSTGFPKIAISPDGGWLAFTSRASELKPTTLVSVVPAAGGAVREIYRAAETAGAGFVTWARDGRHIYFIKRGELWRVTPDGARSEKVDQDVSRVRGWFSFSPDGRRVAFTIGENKSELWALENLAVVKK